MQEDTMFDNTLNSSWDERSRRGLTTLTSFGMQALAIGVLLIVPLLRPAALPLFRSLSTPVSLGRPLGEAPVARIRTGTSATAHNNALELTLRMPTRIPNGISTTSDEDAPQITGSGPSTAGDTMGD